MSYRNALSLASFDHSDKDYRSCKAGVRSFIKNTCARAARRNSKAAIQAELEDAMAWEREDEEAAQEAAMADYEAQVDEEMEAMRRQEEEAFERHLEEQAEYRQNHPACPGDIFGWMDEYNPEQIAWAQEVASRFPLADKDWYAEDMEDQHDAMYDKAWPTHGLYDRCLARTILGIQIEE